MDVDRSFVDVDIAAPYAIEQLLAREHSAGTLHEVLQQPEFGRAELDLLVAAQHAPTFAVQDDVAYTQDRAPALRLRTPQQRSDTRQQLRNRERLDDIIVRPGGEPAHAIG